MRAGACADYPNSVVFGYCNAGRYGSDKLLVNRSPQVGTPEEFHGKPESMKFYETDFSPMFISLDYSGHLCVSQSHVRVSRGVAGGTILGGVADLRHSCQVPAAVLNDE